MIVAHISILINWQTIWLRFRWVNLLDIITLRNTMIWRVPCYLFFKCKLSYLNLLSNIWLFLLCINKIETICKQMVTILCFATINGDYLMTSTGRTQLMGTYSRIHNLDIHQLVQVSLTGQPPPKEGGQDLSLTCKQKLKLWLYNTI